MSSRSNGVTKVLLTRRTIEWVVSSAACSASRIRWAISALDAPSDSISLRSWAPTTRWLAASLKRS